MLLRPFCSLTRVLVSEVTAELSAWRGPRHWNGCRYEVEPPGLAQTLDSSQGASPPGVAADVLTRASASLLGTQTPDPGGKGVQALALLPSVFLGTGQMGWGLFPGGSVQGLPSGSRGWAQGVFMSSWLIPQHLG